MSINSARLNAARRRAFRDKITVESAAPKINSKAAKQPSASKARLLGYNPAGDNYTVVDDLNNRKSAKYIPGNNPSSGGFDFTDEGLFSQDFYLS